MNDNELTITDTEERQPGEQTDFYPEALNEAKPKHEAEAPKRGRPIKTGREAKLTLYMSEEQMTNLKAITDGLHITMTEVINKLIDEYCEKHSDFLDLLKRQEQERRKFQEAHND